MAVSPWDVIDTWPASQQIGFHRGQALKYLMRMGAKPGNDPSEEAAKAHRCLTKLLETMVRNR